MNRRLKITIHVHPEEHHIRCWDSRNNLSRPKIWPSTNISLWHKLPEQFNSVFFLTFYHTYKQYTYLQIFQAIKSYKGMVKKKYFKVVVGPKLRWNPLVYPPAKHIKLHSKCNGLKEIQLLTQWKTKEKQPTWIHASLSLSLLPGTTICIKSLFCHSWQKLFLSIAGQWTAHG